MRFLLQNWILSSSLLLGVAIAQAPTKSDHGTIGSGTYPRATKLSDGSYLAIYTSFGGGNSTLVTAKSTDGLVWTAIGQVDTGSSTAKDMDNGFLHQLPSGRILAAFRNHDRNPSGGWSYYRITICSSDDKGATWKYLSTPVQDSNPVTGDWEPFMQTALNGSLQLYYSHENAANDQDSILRWSTTNGADWWNAQTISGADVTARDGMLGVARVAANSPTMVAIFESGVNGVFSVHSTRSTNDGESWTGRPVVYSPTGHDAGAPQILLVGNRMVASFGTNEDGGKWPEGSIKLLVSYDQGVSWPPEYKTTVHGVPGYWAGLLALDDSSFLVLYESGGTSYAQKYTF